MSGFARNGTRLMRRLDPGQFTSARICTDAGHVELSLSGGGSWQLKVRLLGELDWHFVCSGDLDGRVFVPPAEDEAPIRLGPAAAQPRGQAGRGGRCRGDPDRAGVRPFSPRLPPTLGASSPKRSCRGTCGAPRQQRHPHPRLPCLQDSDQAARSRRRGLHRQLLADRLPAGERGVVGVWGDPLLTSSAEKRCKETSPARPFGLGMRNAGSGPVAAVF